MWQALSEDQKQIYKQKADQDRIRFKAEQDQETRANGGKQLMTASERKQAAIRLDVAPNFPKDGQKKKVQRDPNAPKKPLTPFFIYLHQKRMEAQAVDPNIGKGKDFTAFTARMGQEWNKLTAEQKATYKHDTDLGRSILM